MVIADINYPKNGCSTPCPSMRCQKCILMDSISIFDYLKKDREKDRPDWCPIKKEINDYDEFGNYT